MSKLTSKITRTILPPQVFEPYRQRFGTVVELVETSKFTSHCAKI